MDTTKTKLCLRCKQQKSIDSFYTSCKTKDGYQCYCKSCQKELGKLRRLRLKTKAQETAELKFQITQSTQSALANATPRDLMQELVRRGYTGTLQKTEIKTIDLSKIFD